MAHRHDFPSLEAFLAELPQMAAQGDERLKGHHGLYRLNTLSGRGWSVLVDNGKITLPENISEGFDCVITMDEGLLLNIINKKQSAVKAILFRKVQVQGNPTSLLGLLALI